MNNHRKKIFILILFFVSNMVYSQWTKQESGTTETLRSVSFINENIGWVVGGSRAFKSVYSTEKSTYIALVTVNGGNNWIYAMVGKDMFFKEILMVNSTIGWVLGEEGWTGGLDFEGYGIGYGCIYKTTNSGVDWGEVKSLPFKTDFNSIFFINPNTGWVGGKHALFKTTNGGNSWTNIEGISNMININSVYFLDEKVGWICGEVNDEGFHEYSGCLYMTTNGGINWTHGCNWNRYKAVILTSPGVGCVVADVGINGERTIFKTIDGGNNWYSYSIDNASSEKIWGDIKKMQFKGICTGWVIGGIDEDKGFFISKSIDCGASWYIQLNDTSGCLNSIDFVNSNNGWAVGNRGLILRTTNGGD